MNNVTLDYLMNRVDSRRSRRGRYMRDYDDYADNRRSSRDMRDYDDYADNRRSSRDMRDYNDYADYIKTPRLSKSDMHHWKQMMKNEDGSHGAHYDMQQTMSIADKMGIDFEEHDFDEKEFCTAMNMMYSDYCRVAKKFVAPDKELAFFAEMAKAFLCDEDGPGAAEKLALYFHCIVDA